VAFIVFSENNSGKLTGKGYDLIISGKSTANYHQTKMT